MKRPEFLKQSDELAARLYLMAGRGEPVRSLLEEECYLLMRWYGDDIHPSDYGAGSYVELVAEALKSSTPIYQVEPNENVRGVPYRNVVGDDPIFLWGECRFGSSQAFVDDLSQQVMTLLNAAGRKKTLLERTVFVAEQSEIRLFKCVDADGETLYIISRVENGGVSWLRFIPYFGDAIWVFQSEGGSIGVGRK